MLTTQLDFITLCVALRLDIFIMGLLLKFLYMVEVLLINGYQILKFGG